MKFDPSWMPVIAAFVSGGLLTAAINLFLFSDQKKKLKLEIEKLQLDIDSLKSQVAYVELVAKERMLFDASTAIDGFQISVSGRAHGPSKGEPQGTGSWSIEGNSVIVINRTNTGGRFEVVLKDYDVDGKSSDNIEGDPLANGKRRIHVAFSVRTFDADRKIRTVLKQVGGEQKWLDDQRTVEVTPSDNWTPINCYFRISANETCFVRIDDIEPSVAPSSLQIRGITVIEKMG